MKKVKSMVVRLALCLSAMGALSSTIQASGFDQAMKLAPAHGELFVGVDHAKLAKHQDRTELGKLAVSRGILPAVVFETGSCLESGSNVARSIAVRVGRGSFVHILDGKLERACSKAHFKKRLQIALAKSKGALTGTIGKMHFVAVSGNQVALFVGGDLALVGKIDHLKRFLATTKGKKVKRALKSRKLQKLYRQATKPGAMLWAFSKIPKRLQKRAENTQDAAFAPVQHVVLTADGLSGATVRVRATLKSAKQAVELKKIFERRIEERVGGSMILRAIGIDAMVKNGLKLTTKSRDLEATITITPLQMGVLARSGGKILSILE